MSRVDLKIYSRLLRDKNSQTTLRYAYLSQAHKREVVKDNRNGSFKGYLLQFYHNLGSRPFREARLTGLDPATSCVTATPRF